MTAPSLVGLQTFPTDYFEAAVMRSYLEHELEPLGVLMEVYRVLKPRRIAIVKVPLMPAFRGLHFGAVILTLTRKSKDGSCGSRPKDK